MVSDRGDQGLFSIWTRSFWVKCLISFPLVTAKWIGDLFGKKRCGSNKTLLLITRQFICAPNVRSVKRDAARTRKKSVRSNLVHNLRYEFDSASPFAQEAGPNIYPARIYWRTEILCVSLIDKVIAYSFCWRERKRKYFSQWQTARSKWKRTSIAPGPRHMPNNCKNLNPP